MECCPLCLCTTSLVIMISVHGNDVVLVVALFCKSISLICFWLITLCTPLLFLKFYEDLVDGKGSDEKPKNIPDKPLNKKIKFEDTDSSDDEDEDNSGEEADNGNVNDVEKGETAPSEKQQEVLDTSNTASKDNTALSEKKEEVLDTSDTVSKDNEEQAVTADEPREKKQRVEDPPVFEQAVQKETADEPKESTDKPKESSEKNIDDLIDEDLKEIGDRKKVCLLSGVVTA
jgi:tRNA acetyltransferase TAN1